MSTATQHLLDAFDLLSAAEKQIVICEILRRVQDLDVPPLSDDELVAQRRSALSRTRPSGNHRCLRHSAVRCGYVDLGACRQVTV